MSRHRINIQNIKVIQFQPNFVIWLLFGREFDLIVHIGNMQKICKKYTQNMQTNEKICKNMHFYFIENSLKYN